MRVSELIEILKEQPADAEVQVAMVGAAEGSDELELEPWEIMAVLPWEMSEDDHDHEGHDHDHAHAPGELVIFLVGGDPDDVEDFLEAVEPEEDEA